MGEWENGRTGITRLPFSHSPTLPFSDSDLSPQYRADALACVAGHLQIAAPSYHALAGRTLNRDAALPVSDSGALGRSQFLIIQNRLCPKLKLFARQLNAPLRGISRAARSRMPRSTWRERELPKPDMSAAAICIYYCSR